MSRTRKLLESTHAALHFPLGEVRRHNGTPSKEVQALPWYHLVPKDPIQQLKWRLYVRERGAVDKEFRHAILQACEEDILFCCNTLLWIFEPRREKQKNLPLNTWRDQDNNLVWMDECWGVRNCGTEKSRDLSASWDHCVVSYKHWRFDAQSKIGFASLTEEKVDSADDSDSLMWKALTMETPVLTPNGWVLNGDIRLGDYVVGSNGLPTKVLAVHDHGSKPVFRVLFHDGTSVRCCGNHLWSATTQSERIWNRRHPDAKPHRQIISTAEIAKTIKWSTPSRVQGHRYQVPLPEAIEFIPTTDLPLSPYTVGALLGDGMLNRISVRLCGIDPEIAKRVETELPAGCRMTYDGQVSYGFPGNQGQVTKLVELIGLKGCRAWEKFIPQQYLFASVADRVDLLRGIMDTDGWVQMMVGKRGERSDVFLETTSEQLAKDVAFLVRSLGGTAYGPKSYLRTYKHNGETREGRQAYRIGLVPSLNPFYLKRKADKFRPRRVVDKVIVGVEPDGEDEVRCLTVDAADHLYVVDGVTLTHNCDFLHFNTPEWFRVDHKGQDILERTYFNHKFHNRQNGSTVNGYASTGNLGRGGRKIAWVMDEFSEWNINDQQRALDSTQHSTKCRYFPSTFSGDGDRFFQMMRRESSTMLKLIRDWKDNAWQAAGLYTSIGGKLKILDQSYVFPADYPYILDGKERSPYYDAKCKEPGATPQSIARELDRDPQGATSKVFSASVLQKARESCSPPYFVGNLDFNSTDLQPIWVPDPSGRMFIWRDLDEEAQLPEGGKGKLGYGGPYAVGCDVGVGAGSSNTSNSSLEVIDIASGEEVLQYYWHCIRPIDFAQLVFVVCRWLCVDHDTSWAYVNFESQGPGEAFRDELVRLGWANIYNTREVSKIYQTRTEKLGHHNVDGGYSSLLELQRGIQADEVIVRSEKTVQECGEYEIGGVGARSGKCIHVSSQASGDAASQGKAHGDCAIALALAWMAAQDRPVDKPQPEHEADPEDVYWEQLEKKLLKRADAAALGGESFRAAG